PVRCRDHGRVARRIGRRRAVVGAATRDASAFEMRPRAARQEEDSMIEDITTVATELEQQMADEIRKCRATGAYDLAARYEELRLAAEHRCVVRLEMAELAMRRE